MFESRAAQSVTLYPARNYQFQNLLQISKRLALCAYRVLSIPDERALPGDKIDGDIGSGSPGRGIKAQYECLNHKWLKLPFSNT